MLMMWLTSWSASEAGGEGLNAVMYLLTGNTVMSSIQQT